MATRAPPTASPVELRLVAPPDDAVVEPVPDAPGSHAGSVLTAAEKRSGVEPGVVRSSAAAMRRTPECCA